MFTRYKLQCHQLLVFLIYLISHHMKKSKNESMSARLLSATLGRNLSAEFENLQTILHRPLWKQKCLRISSTAENSGSTEADEYPFRAW